MAPAPHGGGAHADHESTASTGAQRRTTLQEAVVARSGTRATGIVWVGTMGEPATTGSAGVAGSADPDDRGTRSGNRARSGEVSARTAVKNSSRSGCSDRVGVRADHRGSGSVSLRQAGGELSGTGAVGRLQRQSEAARTHHQAGEFDIAFLAGGSSPGHRAQPAGMAQQVLSPGDAAGT